MTRSLERCSLAVVITDRLPGLIHKVGSDTCTRQIGRSCSTGFVDALLLVQFEDVLHHDGVVAPCRQISVILAILPGVFRPASRLAWIINVRPHWRSGYAWLSPASSKPDIMINVSIRATAVTRRVGVNRGHRTIVTRVHRLEHVQRFGTTTLTDDYAFRTHTESSSSRDPSPKLHPCLRCLADESPSVRRVPVATEVPQHLRS